MKALVKHELRNIWAVILYFIGCCIIGAVFFGERLQNAYESYLWNGYSYGQSTNLLSLVSELAEVYIVAIGIGIVVLLYMQFRDNKSIQISSFIKSLPYTNQQIYKVKLGCGILSFTIPLIFGYGAVIALGIQAKEWLSILEKVSPIGQELARYNSIGQLLVYGVLVYALTVVAYTFGFWMQYVVNPNVVSIVVSICALIAVPFSFQMLSRYVEVMMEVENKFSEMLRGLGDTLWLPGQFIKYQRGYEIWLDYAGNQYDSIYSLVNIQNMSIRVVFGILLIAILIVAISLSNKSYKAENQEGFVSYRWAEMSLKIGVTISSVCAGIGVIAAWYDLSRINKVTLHIVMIICGVIGYLVTSKICKMGQR